MWDLTSPTGFYETSHDWNATICLNERIQNFNLNPNNTFTIQHGTSFPLPNFMKHFVTGIGTIPTDILPQLPCTQKNGLHHRQIPQQQFHSHPKLKGSSSGNQRVSLLRKQRVSEESRTNLHHNLNAPDLQTNEDHISKWEQARKSEFRRILMSKSIIKVRSSFTRGNATATKTRHTPIHIAPKAYICKWIMDSKSIWRTRTSQHYVQYLETTQGPSVCYPLQSGPSGNNGCTIIGFKTEHTPKNRYIDVHFHGTDVTTRAIPEARFNELHNTIKDDTHFWN